MNRINLLFALHLKLVQEKYLKNVLLLSVYYCLSKSFVYTVKYHLIQRLITEQKNWIIFFSCYVRFFLFFYELNEIRMRFPPPVISIYTMGGCLFFFLNIDTWTIGRFVKWEFCTLWLSLVKEMKNFGFFLTRHINYITYDWQLYSNMGGYWKRHLLSHARLFIFCGIYSYNYN